MLWIIWWILALVIFLLIPFCFNPVSRKRVLLRVQHCRWDVEDLLAEEMQESRRPNEPFHYVLSRQQEEEIRESYLLEQLNKFSKTLQGADIVAIPCETSKGNATENDDSDATYSDVASDVEAPPSGEAQDRPSTAYEAGSCEGFSSDDEMDEFMGDSSTLVIIPEPGESAVGTSLSKQRRVPNGCAVCLSPFTADDRISWSSNASCTHVFHQKCILDWLKTSGRKALRRQRREEERSRVVATATDPVQSIISCPALCPCCRQSFIEPSPGDSSDEDDVEKGRPRLQTTATELSTTSASALESNAAQDNGGAIRQSTSIIVE